MTNRSFPCLNKKIYKKKIKEKKKSGIQLSEGFFSVKSACSHASCWSLLSPPRLSHSLRRRACCHLPTTRSFRWEPRMTRRRGVVEMLPIGARARNQYSPNMITTKSRTVSLPPSLSLSPSLFVRASLHPPPLLRSPPSIYEQRCQNPPPKKS